MERNYDFRKAEKETQDFWDREGIYAFDPDGEGEIYSIDTPPPTVSGSLHIGHIFSYTQAEMIARYKRMRGFNVFYPFGFDDNGLPTERLVEREQGVLAKDLPRSEFAALCAKTAEKYESEFVALWKSLGFSADWSLLYRTAGADVQKISQKLFLDLVKMGRAYAKESPVLWCTECRTSIAQAELDTKDVDSAFNTIPFRVGDSVLEVATTRPELLYGCVCLFVHPEDERYRSYVGSVASVPLYNYEIPILTDEKVDMDLGTGVVMCATFGDSTDAEWYAKHSLPYRRVILPDGRIDGAVPFIGGLRVGAARKEIIHLLGEKGLLLKSESVTHTVAVHERCGKEIEIIPSRQWYIDILSEKERFLKAADGIYWYPGYMKARYISWVENLKWDWCISRQRYFGIPFPVWYCRACGKPAFADESMLPVNPLETEYPGVCSCGCREFIPESAVFDTWATSSVTPQINERSGLPLVPMGMRAQAHEIIRTWTFYTIARSLYHTGKLPWRDIMISGFVLAKKGEKISKSKQNSSLSPERLIAENSADAVRYWAANARLGTDTFFSQEELGASKRFLTKLWNASRFALSRLEDIDLTTEVKYYPADRWIMAKADETVLEVSALLDGYEIGMARHEIDEFFWKDFCDNYIEIAKERLYLGAPEVGRPGAQRALYYALLTILKLYAPYVPHITEYLYQDFFRRHEKTASIHKTLIPSPGAPDAELLAFGESLKSAISEVRKQKSERNLSMKDEIEEMVVSAPERLLPLFRESEFDLRSCSRAKRICYKSI